MKPTLTRKTAATAAGVFIFFLMLFGGLVIIELALPQSHGSGWQRWVGDIVCGGIAFWACMVARDTKRNITGEDDEAP